MTEVPFDLVVNYVPQVLRAADANLQRLASQGPQDVEGFQAIVGNSPTIRAAVGRASRVARRDVSVLILGESGTGQELFARAIHEASRGGASRSCRSTSPHSPRNCSNRSCWPHERQLHRAERDRDGAFKTADGGTLFLDEIGECDPAMQAAC